MRLDPGTRRTLESAALGLSFIAVGAVLGGPLLAVILWDDKDSAYALILGAFTFVSAVVLRFTLHAVLDRADGVRVRRRDQCPRCGYDLSAHARNAPCPECGCGGKYS